MNTESEKYFVYVLPLSDGSFYTGYTHDIKQRLREHMNGTGSKYVRSRLPIGPNVYVEEHKTKRKAMQREIAIKKMKSQDKAALFLYAGLMSNSRVLR